MPTSYKSEFSDVFAQAGEERRQAAYPDMSGAEIDLTSDPTWQKIQSTFQDILGTYADMDVEMPIALPDTQDPQDVLRYLGELEKAGIDSRASASYLGGQQRGGAQFSDALNMMKFLYRQQQDHLKMLVSLVPNVADKEMQAQLTTEIMNRMQPGYYGTMAESWLPGTQAKTTTITEENVTSTIEFRKIADAYGSQLASLIKADDNENYDIMMNQIEQLLITQYKWPTNIVNEALERIHAEALTAKMAGVDIYGEL